MNKTQLKKRGWTENLINRFIRNAQKCNGRYSFCINEIERIESTTAFKLELNKVERIRAQYAYGVEQARQLTQIFQEFLCRPTVIL